MRLSTLAFAIASVSLVACGADPVQYSEPVGITLKAKSSDVATSAITEDKGITTESGNPYGAFVSNARAKLGGKDPSRIEVDDIQLLLGAGSTNVTTLGQVFTGTTDVLFVMNDTNNSYPVGTGAIAATATAGPLPIGVTFDGTMLPTADFAKMLTGSFKVELRGPASVDFMGKGADANLQVTFRFTAFE
jgi:hypothetical protein